MSSKNNTPPTSTATSEEIAGWVEQLSSANRRARQEASHELGLIAPTQAKDLAPQLDALIDALFLPEAQTRWEVLNALTYMEIQTDEAAVRAVEGAETSLFDESSSTLRLAAFRLLCKLGATAPVHSDQAWPLLNEAIQCFHGDPEYRDMLVALVDFASGDISDDARALLIKRISFDANNGHGYILTWSKRVVAAAQGEAVE